MSQIKTKYKSLNSKWIFTIKYNVNNDIMQFKIR